MEPDIIKYAYRPEEPNTTAFTCCVRGKDKEHSKMDELIEISTTFTAKEHKVAKRVGLLQWDWKGGGDRGERHSTCCHADGNHKNVQNQSTAHKRIMPKYSTISPSALSKASRLTKNKKNISNTYDLSFRICRSFTSSTLGIILVFAVIFQCLCVQTAFSQVTEINRNICNQDSDCHPSSVNLLNSNYPMRTVDVSSTCGTPEGTTTIYRKSSATFDFDDYFCNASDPHPKEYMYDHQNEKVLDYEFENPKLNTYWQSINTIAFVGDGAEQQYVIFNMSEPFLIRYIRVVFISPHIMSKTDDSDMRPRAMVIERQADPSAEWEAWRYYADRCLFYFGFVPFQSTDGSGPDYDAMTPVCQDRYYSGSTPVTGWGYGRQEVIFNPSSDYDREFQTSALVQRHYLASAIRLTLVQPSDSEPLSSYYAIGDLEVDGQCACFGHASDCTGDNAAICVCNHYTEGKNCERCLPLFNNKPWRAGALQKANACEDCGCGGHALSCHYDADKQYGVCDNCTDNTTGDKCHLCDEYFYINPENRTQISPSAQCSGFNGTDFITYDCNNYCIPCNCSLFGSDPAGGFTCQNSTGECECKTHVEGRDCSLCKDEYWNLTANNQLGCIPCDCERSGTFNNTLLCDKDDGQCICKDNTHGYRCSDCKPGYFGLSLFNMLGCESCGCDPGASLNTTCPVNTGICPCRDWIEGRECKNPLEGYYVPALDHLTFDAEFIDNITAQFTVVERPGHGENDSAVTGRGFVEIHELATITFTVAVPRTQMYHVVLRYETGAIWINAHISMKATDPGDATQYTCGSTVVNTADNLQLQMTIEPASMRGGADFGQLCLMAGLHYDLNLELGNADPRNELLLLDSVVLLPALMDLPFFGTISPAERELMQDCYRATVPLDLATRTNYSCAQTEYSIMAYIYDGAQECQCDLTGSNSTLCDPMGGQCSCKVGVTLLDCSQCQVDHYGFYSGEGCIACNCDPKGSVHTACNDTGICECKENVQGLNCDECVPEHYGLFTGNGCEKCTCNLEYSYNNSCEDSGQCHCKPGIGGKNCDKCEDGFYALTADGCTPCNCDDGGSTSHLCDKITGICTCKTLAVGDKCDQCLTGYFALGDWSPLGCLQCYCSGHSTVCDSASGWFLTNASNDWSLLNSMTAIEGPWLGVDDLGDPVTVEHPSKIIGNDGQFVMQIVNNEENLHRDNLFFLAMENYLGNKRSAYMHNFTFALSMYVPPPGENQTLDLQLVDTQSGDVILESEHLTFKLVVALPAPPDDNMTEFTYQMNTDTWHVDTINGPNPTYIQMIQMLSELSAIKIRAKYSNVTGAEVALYSALLTYAVNDNTSGIPVNNVENCTCPKQYMGEECEMCAPGYTRLTPGGGPFTDCVPCNCHGHEAPGEPCDPETGQCTCIHNTEGLRCELCTPGYYGDPTRGNPDACKSCTCPGDVIAGDVNVFAVTCELGPQGTPVCHNCTEGHSGDKCDVCLDHWYGVPSDPTNNQGRCVPCECNGRADLCNSTSGFCFDCANNTAGKECDICAPTYFGNAMINACENCNCGLPGATGDCDHRTGQCVCKTNVVGFDCSECGPNSFNYSSGEGCHDCDCHLVGSLDSQCDVITGQCVCNTHLIDRQCNKCEDTYWHINAVTGCDPCLCTEAGSANITGETFGVCDLETGQCQCARDAIIGRTCDYCAKGTKGSYPNCELCGECFDNWAAKIDETGEAAESEYIQALQIWDHYGNMTVDIVLPIIGNLSANLTLVEGSINNTYLLVTSLRDIQQRYDNIASNVTFLTGEIEELEAFIDLTEGNLTMLQNFDGTIHISPTTSTSVTQIMSLETEVRNLHLQIYQQANSSWDNIQNMTEAVRLSNGSVQVFVERVASAMTELDDAAAMAEATELLLTGGFSAENENNSLALQKQEGLMQLFPTTIVNARQIVEDAYVKVLQANVTIDSAQAAVDVKRVEMAAKLQEAQTTIVNATGAKAAADSVKLVVDILKDQSSYTRGNLTQALVDVLDGLHSIDNITQAVFLMDQQAVSIEITLLQPMEELTAITGQIEATAVSDSAVEELMKRSEQTLAEASRAINVTATAADSAYQTLELVRSIQRHLEDAGEERATTDEHLRTLHTYNKTITETTAAVHVKAGQALELSGEIHRNVSQSALEINDIYRCFQDKQQRANKTKSHALAAQQTVEKVAEVHVENIQHLANVTMQTTALEGKYTDYLQSLLDVKNDVDDLLDDLGLVSGSSDVDVLLADIEVQKAELTKLQTELKTMDGEIGQTLSKLEQLDPNTAQCSHN